MSALIPRDLRQRRDAIVLRAEPLDQTRRMTVLNTELQQHNTKWQALAALNRQVQRREVRVIRGPVWNGESTRWESRVVRLRPRWRRPLLIGLAIGTPIAALLGAVWWTLTALSMTAVVSLCAVAICGLFGIVRAHRSIVVEQHQKVTIR